MTTLKQALAPWQTSPAARAYWASMRKEEKDWSDGSERTGVPADQLCQRCGNAGFFQKVYVRDGVEVGREYVPCDNPLCATRRKFIAQQTQKIVTASGIPSEYAKMTLEKWHTLEAKRRKADGTHPMNGKRDAFGAALAFTRNADQGFFFTKREAAEAVGLPPPNVKDEESGEIRPLKDESLNWLVLSGTNGVGKTSLAAAIANDLLPRGYAVVYVRMSAFFLAIKSTWNEKRETQAALKAPDEAEVMRLYATAPILIIDEFPERCTDWQRDKGGELINERYSNGLPTVITTNVLTPQALETYWQRLVADRIASRAHWLVMGGVELRKRNAATDSR